MRIASHAARWLPIALLLVAAPAAWSATGLDLQGRIVVDGQSNDFLPGESLFGFNEDLAQDEESRVDSRWQDNDIAQLHLTWDADSVYIAGDGIINGNNMILLWDVGNPHPGVFATTGIDFDGLGEMTNLNSWRRNFVFAEPFRPDLFAATWDGNTAPHLLTASNDNSVVDEQPAGTGGGPSLFRSVASFQGTQSGRSMEVALPWWKFMGFPNESGLSRRFSPALGDSVPVLPDGVRFIRVVGVITAGGDGTGGPDSAPDNFGGHEVDGSIQVVIDNWITVDLDTLNDETGEPGPDRIPDFGIDPRDRVEFVERPPINPVRIEFDQFQFSRPYLAPERGEEVEYTFNFRPELPPEQRNRRTQISASIYDLRGEKVRTLYTRDFNPSLNDANPRRLIRDPVDPRHDRWDGRNDDGEIVKGGVYLLRLILEPDLARLTKAVGVKR